MITFAGRLAIAFTVTDLDASERFYTDVLDFVVVMVRVWPHLHTLTPDSRWGWSRELRRTLHRTAPGWTSPADRLMGVSSRMGRRFVNMVSSTHAHPGHGDGTRPTSAIPTESP